MCKSVLCLNTKNGDYFIYHAYLRHLYSYVFQICTHVGDIQHVCDLKAHSEAHSEIYIIPFKPKTGFSRAYVANEVGMHLMVHVFLWCTHTHKRLSGTNSWNKIITMVNRTVRVN